MKELRNNTLRHLSSEEHRALLDMVDALEKAFKKKVHTVTVTPDKENQEDVFGIMVGFDKYFFPDRGGGK